MNIFFNSITNHSIYFLKETVLPSLSAQRKKILVVVTIAFALLSALCLAGVCWFNATRKFDPETLSDDKDLIDQETLSDDKDFIGEEFFDEDILDKTTEVKEIIEEDQQKSHAFDEPIADGTNPFTWLPIELLIPIFSNLDIKGWNALSRTDMRLQLISKQPEIIASVLEEKNKPFRFMSLVKHLELIKLAGPFVRKLNLGNTWYNDEKLEEIFKACPKIKVLDLSRTLLTGAVIDKLPIGLKRLNLEDCANLKTVDNLPIGLKWLCLNGCTKLTDADLGNLPAGLQTLYLQSHDLTRAIIDKLPSRLETLSLRFIKLSDDDVGNLPHTLRTVVLLSTTLTDACTAKLHKGLQSVVLIVPNLTDAAIALLPSGLKSLKLCSSNLSVLDILPPELQSLNLHGCKNLIDKALDNLPPGLKDLDITGCEKLTSAIIDKLPDSLQTLCLIECDEKLRQVAVERLSKKLHRLKLHYYK